MADLRTNQRKAIAALLSEPTIRAAAKAAGLGERTIHRYLGDAAFKTELRKRQDQLLSAMTAALVGLSGEAVETLRALLESGDTSASVKARVALGWLRELHRTLELQDLAERVTALEEHIL